MLSFQRASQRNRLLANLPAADRARLEPHLLPVDLPLGEVVYESGQELIHMYFPLDSIVCRLYVLENGNTGQTAVIGNDGVIGISGFMGGCGAPSRAEVQSAGTALRISADIVRAEFDRGGALQQLMLRYIQVVLTQMGQAAICNRHHTLEQQLCRWFLMSLDRLSGDELAMTHEMIANVLGVRREGVTEAAGRLQKAGVISYQRGLIKVLDRSMLERMTCECYEVVRTEADRLLPREAGAEVRATRT